MKNYFVGCIKCVIFVFFMAAVGLMTAEPFEGDGRGVTFACIAVIAIIAWLEIKGTILQFSKH